MEGDVRVHSHEIEISFWATQLSNAQVRLGTSSRGASPDNAECNCDVNVTVICTNVMRL